MDIITPFAPTPGSAKPGNLYADLQTRTLWLGVEAAVDPAQAVLISDIVALQAEIDDALVTAKAYTDTQITTRAPTVHTHTSSQITNFTAAVQTVVSAMPSVNWLRGMIIQWSGSLAEIGVGGLAGWALCDGANGTPNLRDKFVLGAGTRAVGSVNPNTSFNTADDGTHVHTINSTAITIAQMPVHDHGGLTGGHSVSHTHGVNINTGTESHFHTHQIAGAATQSTSGGNRPSGSGGTSNVNTTNQDQLHWHNVNGNTGGANVSHTHAIADQGSGQAHPHTIVGGGGIHHHNTTSLVLREAIPFYALAFIMKL